MTTFATKNELAIVKHDVNRVEVLLEEATSNNQAILEIVVAMKEKVDRIPAIEERLTRIETDSETFQAALTDTSTQVRGHEWRIALLESIT